MACRNGPHSGGLLAVISGPSGAGKTTIVHEVVRRLDGVFSVSATTRARTPKEIHGKDYFFVDEPEFQRMIDEGEFLEYAQVFGKAWYGTPRGPVEAALARGRLVVLEIDVQGGLQVKRAMPEAFMVFVMPPSEEELLARLRRRAREDEASIRRRFAEFRRELQVARESGAYDAFVVNADLQDAIDEVCGLIEGARASRG